MAVKTNKVVAHCMNGHQWAATRRLTDYPRAFGPNLIEVVLTPRDCPVCATTHHHVVPENT